MRDLIGRRGLVVGGLVVLVAVGVFVAANLTRQPVRTPLPQPAGTDSSLESESPTPPGKPDVKILPRHPSGDADPKDVVQVWFLEVDENAEGTLTAGYRDVGGTLAVGRAAMEALLAGPSGPESETGVSTTIPEATQLLGLTIEDGVATVDLSTEFDESGLGTCCEDWPLAQVVFTLTQFDTVDAVVFQIEGETVVSYGGHGESVDKPQKRKDYEGNAPPIIVDFPFPGQQIDSTFELQGSANVFEATVSYRIVDENGAVLKDGFTTASCGSGCRGDYSEKTTLDVEQETDVVIEVFESSAEDGSPLHMVEVPVTIVP